MTEQELRDGIGERIRYWRKVRGMTQEGLAALAGMGSSEPNLAENGRRNLTLRTLGKYAVALRCDVADLIPREKR